MQQIQPHGSISNQPSATLHQVKEATAAQCEIKIWITQRLGGRLPAGPNRPTSYHEKASEHRVRRV